MTLKKTVVTVLGVVILTATTAALAQTTNAPVRGSDTAPAASGDSSSYDPGPEISFDGVTQASPAAAPSGSAGTTVTPGDDAATTDQVAAPQGNGDPGATNAQTGSAASNGR